MAWLEAHTAGNVLSSDVLFSSLPVDGQSNRKRRPVHETSDSAPGVPREPPRAAAARSSAPREGPRVAHHSSRKPTSSDPTCSASRRYHHGGSLHRLLGTGKNYRNIVGAPLTCFS